MSVVAFRPRAQHAGPAGWRAEELAQLLQLYAALAGERPRLEYELGETEYGEPQFYVLGHDSDRPCLACVSRLRSGAGDRFILEDGRGLILAEGGRLDDVLAAGRAAARPRRRLALTTLLAGLLLPSLDTQPSGVERSDLVASLDLVLLELVARFVPVAVL